MPKVISLIRKPKEWLWFGHKCACYEYWLRGDGVIVCTKCGEEVGTWQQK